MPKNKNLSESERTTVHELCKTYLKGEWTQVKEKDLTIRIATDGFVNKIYFCFLPESIQTKHNRVVVRIDDSEEVKGFFNKTHAITISIFASEKGISPRVFAVFTNGSIIEYIKCRYFSPSDDINNKTVELLAQKVAKLHSLEVPIPKNSTKETNDAVFKRWFNEELRYSYREGVVREEIEKHNFEFLSKLDFIDEMVFMRKTMEQMNSPIVLSHNDLNRSNILIREQDSHEMEIFLIDFDWSSYDYRGKDLGQYFANWGQEYNDFDYIEFPTDQQMYEFIEAYIKEMCKICGTSYAKQYINSRERLIIESKVFALFVYLKHILGFIWTATKTRNKIVMIRAEQRFKCYFELKTKLLKEYNSLK